MSWDDDHKDVCQVWDCELPARQYGVCAKHLKIAELGDPRDDETQQVLALIKAGKDGIKMTDGICRVPGCGKTKIAGRGLCMTHYLYKKSKESDRVALFNKYATPLGNSTSKKIKADDEQRANPAAPIIDASPKKRGRPRKATTTTREAVTQNTPPVSTPKAATKKVGKFDKKRMRNIAVPPEFFQNPDVTKELAATTLAVDVAEYVAIFYGRKCLATDDGSLLLTTGSKLLRIWPDGRMFQDYLPEQK